jgi:hypothetical protein
MQCTVQYIVPHVNTGTGTGTGTIAARYCDLVVGILQPLPRLWNKIHVTIKTATATAARATKRTSVRGQDAVQHEVFSDLS